ncbi:OprD family porin [Pseudomonas sp. v388]|uniref:OprD family porin n=1 Tax=Pseudomonas sp. v388 TaxID=2479849 RepID=UPI000F7768AE|nr:OprD family porin [Pseudomonas sp. v388]RRV10507.1 OprD family porin [Pseudomonas sp. v388]
MATHRVTCLALIPFVCLEAKAAPEQPSDFFNDSKLTVTARNFYFNRDFRNGGSSSTGTNASKPIADRNGYQEEWAQGFMANFTSGFTPGVVGFGVDAYSFQGFKLDSGGGRTGLRLMPIGGDGKPEDSFNKAGGSFKIRYQDGLFQYGNLFPNVPVFAVNQVRLFPSSATGWMLGWNVDKLHLDSGHFFSRGGVDSSNNDDPITTDYALPLSIDSVSYVGGKYTVDKDLKLSLYGSELEDVWRQYYANVNYRYEIDQAQAVLVDANLYRTLDTGRQLASVINNTTWSISVGYRYLQHTFTLAYQKVDSDEPMDWAAFGTMGGSVSLANAVQYATFTEPNERSFQARYDLDMAAFGVPGLTFMTRYVTGDQVSNRDSNNTFYTRRFVYPAGSDPRHWERDIEARYVVQSGPAKDLSVRLRQATHRSSTGYRYPDDDEIRVIIDYPISIF